MTRVVQLVFANKTDNQLCCLAVTRDSVPPIMEWYGAFHAGDDYTVCIDGLEQNQGINGELEPITIDTAHEEAKEARG